MTISLNSIPADLRNPGQYVEFDSSKAISGLPAAQDKILVIGQRLTAGTVAAGVLTRIVSAAQGVQAFGRGSMLAQMLTALKAVNDDTECWAIALDDLGGGVTATGTLTVTGTATSAGTLAFMIAGVKVPVGVVVGDTPTIVATSIVAAIAANPDLPVSAANTAGVVTLTAKHKGTGGNDIDVRLNYFQGDVNGAPATTAVAIVAMASGAGNPDIAAVWAAIGDSKYATMILPFVDAATLTSVETELTSRWGPMRMIEAMAYGSFRGSMSAAATLGTSRNSAWVSILPMRGALLPTWSLAAAYGGVIALYGSIDPARPFQTLPLAGVLAPAVVDRFTRQERELLLHDGMSTYRVDSGGNVLIDRAITTYQTSAFGLPDVAYLDVNTPLTLAYIRYAVRTRIATKFPRMKLADDNTTFGAGQAIVTPKIIRAELIALFRELENAGLVEDLDQFKADLIVERDASDRNRINALIPPNIVNQFRVFAGAVQFRL